MKINNIACIGGEISPSLWSRIDLDKVKVGLAKCHNFIPFAHGGARYRMGTKFIAEVNSECVLHSMEYTSEPSIMIEFGVGYIKFVREGSYIMADETTPYEIESPYTKGDLKNIKIAQSIDVLFICDGRNRIKTLSRYSDTNWALTDYEYKYGPFFPMNGDETIKLTVLSKSGSTGKYGETVTVQSSINNMFQDGDVGRWIKLEYMDTGSVISDGNKVPSGAQLIAGPFDVDGKWEMRYRFDDTVNDKSIDVQYSVDGGVSWEVYDSCPDITKTTSVNIEGELRAEDFNYITPKIRLYSTGTTAKFYWTIKKIRELRIGYLKISHFENGQKVDAVVHRRCTQLNIANKAWAFGAWSDSAGYPSVVTFYPGDRLMFGGTPSGPSDIWASVVGDYNNYEVSVEALADEGLYIPIRSRHLDEIRSIIPLKDLISLTSGGEWLIRGTSEGNVLTPDSQDISNQGYNGSSTLDPVIAGNSVLFVQKYGSKVRDLAYTYDKDGYDSTDRTIYARHLFEGFNIIDWCYQQEPYSLIWAVRSDGKVLGFTWLKEHDVWAWHLHDFGGVVETIERITGTDGDTVYMVVRREVDGEEKRYLEKLSDSAEEIFLDSSLEFCACETSITGLEHLEGLRVNVKTDDGTVYANLLVENGEVPLARPANKATVGLSYEGTVRTLPVFYETRYQSSVGARRRACSIILEVLDSFSGEYGTDDDHMYEFTYDDNKIFSGTMRRTLDSVFDYKAQISIRQSKPFPFTILSWAVEVDHGDTNYSGGR